MVEHEGHERTYRIIVTVNVFDVYPHDPDAEEDVVYAAYAKAKDDMNENKADWYAEEVVG